MKGGKPWTIGEALEAYDPELARQMMRADAVRKAPSAGRTWHIVQCIGKSDQHALDWLSRLRFEIYYPMIRERRPVPKKLLTKRQRASGVRLERPVLVAFLPRYIFVRFDLNESGWHEIFDFAGLGLMTQGDRPFSVPDADVEGIRAREVDGAIPGKMPAGQVFSVGQRVRVKEGPFAMREGTVERLSDTPIEDVDADTRIRIALSAFGGVTPVELTVGQVEKF